MRFIINVDTNILARAEGIEPTSLVLETNIITIILSTHNNVPRVGFKPTTTFVDQIRILGRSFNYALHGH